MDFRDVRSCTTTARAAWPGLSQVARIEPGGPSCASSRDAKPRSDQGLQEPHWPPRPSQILFPTSTDHFSMIVF